MKQPTKKLLSTVAFAALASIALPAFAQEAPATTDQPSAVSAPAPIVTPTIVPEATPAPILQSSQPTPSVVLPSQGAAQTPVASARPMILPVPKLDVPVAPIASRSAIKARPVATEISQPAPSRTTDGTTTQRRSTEAITAPIAPITQAPIAMAPPVAEEAQPGASIAATPAKGADGTDWALIGGIAAAGSVAALGLGGLAIARRRRDDEFVSGVVAAAPIADRSFAAAGPVAVPMAATPAMDNRDVPMVALARADYAGEGSHIAAAMRGPTAENPFLTERARIRRAHFLDKQAASQPNATPMRDLAETSTARPARAAQSQTTYVLGKAKPSRFGFGLRPSRT